MSIYDESAARDLAALRNIVVDTIQNGSGINVNANFNIGDIVGITNAAGDPVDPATTQNINSLRLDTARITQPSGQRLMANSESMVLASNHPIVPVSITVSGQQPQGTSLSVGLASDLRILPVSVAVSGQQTAANSVSVTLASNQIPTVGVVLSGLTASSPTNVSVGIASTTLVASNTGRRGLNVTNVSANVISLAFGATAVLLNGITLWPQGTFNMDQFCYTTAQVNAIASGAGSFVAVQEWT